MEGGRWTYPACRALRRARQAKLRDVPSRAPSCRGWRQSRGSSACCVAGGRPRQKQRAMGAPPGGGGHSSCDGSCQSSCVRVAHKRGLNGPGFPGVWLPYLSTTKKRLTTRLRTHTTKHWYVHEQGTLHSRQTVHRTPDVRGAHLLGGRGRGTSRPT